MYQDPFVALFATEKRKNHSAVSISERSVMNRSGRRYRGTCAADPEASLDRPGYETSTAQQPLPEPFGALQAPEKHPRQNPGQRAEERAHAKAQERTVMSKEAQ